MSTRWWATGLAVLAGCALASGVVVWLVRGWAQHWLMDIPNDRSSHVHPTPRGGGIGIVATVVIGLVAVARFLGEPQWLVVALSGTVVAAVSLADDLRPLPPLVRLVCHVVVVVGALAFLSAGPRALPGLDSWAGLVIAPVVLVWVVGLMNAYNFMDGIDGLAGTQAFVAGLGWVMLGTWCADGGLSTAGLVVAGAGLGFLWHNWPPARIFMGDVGSVFLGYVLAMLAVLGAACRPRVAAAGVLLVWPFVFDASVTLLRRAARGENVMRAHRSHLYQRLTTSGWTHGRTTALYGSMAGVGVGCGALCVSGGVLGAAVAALVTTVCAAVLWRTVAAVEARARANPPLATAPGRTTARSA